MRNASKQFTRGFIFVANRLWLIVVLYVISIILFAGLFALAEGGYTFHDGLWWAVITALSIGYGDITPATGWGRLITVVAGHLWLVTLLPLIVANFVVRVIINHDQFTHGEQEWLMNAVKQIAGYYSIDVGDPPKDR